MNAAPDSTQRVTPPKASPMNATYEGRCFCGAVQFTVSGEPVAMGYCHCDSCRTWSAGPVNAFTLWPEGSVTVNQGAEQIGTYNKTERSYRKWCKTCGGHLFTEHPMWHLTDVYAALLPQDAFQPKLHVHYQETRLHLHDGLPKMRDVPQEMGGSGQTLAE
ncbi:MAG: GFA family protein [Polaromonas sp.]